MTSKCLCCGGAETASFFEITRVPVSIGVQWPTEQEAIECKRGDIRLLYCRSCGFIWNDRFKPELMEYSERYDNSLDFSARFRRFAEELARRLIETYAIRKKRVVEIGCGKGHFLNLLCEMGENCGVGFDPSFQGERVGGSAAERIVYHQEFYGEKHSGHRADLVCCRHVFEHIPDPIGFLTMVHRTVDNRDHPAVYFEVPNVRFILERLSVWDIIYEHCNYFSSESLTQIFARCGFSVLRLEASYGGQFLSLDARASKTGDNQDSVSANLSELTKLVERFSDAFSALVAKWQNQLNEMALRGQRAVVWGGGSKAVSFLNMLEVGQEISHVVDINPHKQGRHVPGSGQEIIAPERLTEIRPDLVIVMNPLYREEIGRQLVELGLETELIPV